MRLEYPDRDNAHAFTVGDRPCEVRHRQVFPAHMLNLSSGTQIEVQYYQILSRDCNIDEFEVHGWDVVPAPIVISLRYDHDKPELAYLR